MIVAVALAVAGLEVEVPDRVRFEAPAGWARADGDLDDYASPGEDPPLAVLVAPECPGAGLSVYEVMMPASGADAALPYLRDLCLGDDATLRDARTQGALARISCDRPSHGRMSRQIYAATTRPRAKVVVFEIPLACWDDLEAAVERAIGSIRDIDPRPPPDEPAPYQSRTYARKSLWQQLGALPAMLLALGLIVWLYRKLRRR